jgi:hypothetical protein
MTTGEQQQMRHQHMPQQRLVGTVDRNNCISSRCFEFWRVTAACMHVKQGFIDMVAPT